MHNEVKSETVSKSDMVKVSHFSMATIGEQEQLCAMGGGGKRDEASVFYWWRQWHGFGSLNCLGKMKGADIDTISVCSALPQ